MIKKTTFISLSVLAYALVAVPIVACNAEQLNKSAGLIQIGEMHKVIGKKQHHGRVELAEIVNKPHFYGVGALEAIRGEITVLNSVAIITGVTQDGRPQPMDSDAKATMIVGQSVSEWMDITMTEEVSHEQFDRTLKAMATSKGIDVSKPFIFVIEGEFNDVRLHVINGVCPIRARMMKLDTHKGNKPFELEVKTVNGTLVGVYAADSVGKLTHPATSTHTHLIYMDGKTGERVTGHIEQVGLAKEAILKLPVSGK
ncbi:hypothetical protein PN36_33010 [Candidatus Thiomargarita nelsonii]|uniref:Uncharacterized protein n=1 Tax=Candidatus Thiomargarita nelsonii TaxID=1003181 RepID=A0A4E0QJC9_9GAMM|nr:hypothetical protein PN36_33010 [Candidatus Thiomargarita nelsonii]